MAFSLELKLPKRMRFSVIMSGFNCGFLEFLGGKVFQILTAHRISPISFVFLIKNERKSISLKERRENSLLILLFVVMHTS